MASPLPVIRALVVCGPHMCGPYGARALVVCGPHMCGPYGARALVSASHHANTERLRRHYSRFPDALVNENNCLHDHGRSKSNKIS